MGTSFPVSEGSPIPVSATGTVPSGLSPPVRALNIKCHSTSSNKDVYAAIIVSILVGFITGVGGVVAGGFIYLWMKKKKKKKTSTVIGIIENERHNLEVEDGQVIHIAEIHEEDQIERAITELHEQEINNC
ncbi:hypothetical protein ACFE04_010744 [Oxalis oulophora]